MRISTNCPKSLVWATRANNVSWANFGHVDIPSGTKTFIVVLAYCERPCPSTGRRYFYFAYKGSLYIHVDKSFPAVAAKKLYRPVNGTYLNCTTLSGQFRVLPHPAIAYRIAAVKYLKIFKDFLQKNDVVKHGQL